MNIDSVFDKLKQHNHPWVKDGTVLLVRHGSHAYGTNTETSDEDFKGIAIPPREFYFGFRNKFEQAEMKEPDLVIYDIRKFFSLAAECNPNIIEVLHTDPSDHIIVSDIGKIILDNKDKFLSKKIKLSFMGYATSQLKKMKIAPPPEGDISLLGKKKQIEAKYGFNTKHAYQMVRLLEMCCEIGTTGKVIVKRPNKDKLLYIRNGGWKLNELIQFAKDKEEEIKNIFENCNILPDQPDYDYLNKLCVELISKKYNNVY